MKFSGRHDIKAPVDTVFDAVTDFDGFVQQAIDRGADVVREDSGVVKVGSSWKVGFTYRGSVRKMTLTVTDLEQERTLIDMTSPNFIGSMEILLSPQDSGVTRMDAVIELLAKTLKARLLLQSLRLAKGRLDTQLNQRLADFALDVEAQT